MNVSANGAIQLALKGGWATESETIRKVRVVESLAYLLVGESGLQVLEVSSPTNPAPLGPYDVLFDMANRRDIGSYGFIVDRGWTSMPEAWDAGTSASMNHCMLGHIQQWFYHHLAGMQCDSAGPGFKRIIIRPQIVGDPPPAGPTGAQGLTWVKSHHDSLHGRIAVHWQREGDRLKLDVTIPVNTRATVYVPVSATDAQSVTESGIPAVSAECVKFLRQEAGAAVFEVPSGNYHFEAVL